MEFVCRRCTHFTKTLYHVTTEDGGVVLLNMLVCHSCARAARRLGLPAVKMEPAKTAAKANRVEAMTGQDQDLPSNLNLCSYASTLSGGPPMSRQVKGTNDPVKIFLFPFSTLAEFVIP